jgi:hypothetical protein
VKLAKRTALEKHKDLLKIEDSFRVYSKNNAERLFRELFIQQTLDDIENGLIGENISENEKNELELTCKDLMELSGHETQERCQKILSIIK